MNSHTDDPRSIRDHIIIRSMVMGDIEQSISERADDDVKLALNDAIGLVPLEVHLMSVFANADLACDMSVHERIGVRLTTIEQCQADVLRLRYIERYAKVLREYLEGVTDGKRDHD